MLMRQCDGASQHAILQVRALVFMRSSDVRQSTEETCMEVGFERSLKHEEGAEKARRPTKHEEGTEKARRPTKHAFSRETQTASQTPTIAPGNLDRIGLPRRRLQVAVKSDCGNSLTPAASNVDMARRSPTLILSILVPIP